MGLYDFNARRNIHVNKTYSFQKHKDNNCFNLKKLMKSKEEINREYYNLRCKIKIYAIYLIKKIILSHCKAWLMFMLKRSVIILK